MESFNKRSSKIESIENSLHSPRESTKKRICTLVLVLFLLWTLAKGIKETYACNDYLNSIINKFPNPLLGRDRRGKERTHKKGYLWFSFCQVLNPNKNDEVSLDCYVTRRENAMEVLRRIEDLVSECPIKPNPHSLAKSLPESINLIIGDLQSELNSACIFLLRKEIEEKQGDQKEGSSMFSKALEGYSIDPAMLEEVGVNEEFINALKENREISKETEEIMNKHVQMVDYVSIQTSINIWRIEYTNPSRRPNKLRSWIQSLLDVVRKDENGSLYTLDLRAEKTASYSRIADIYKVLSRLNTMLVQKYLN